MTALDEDQVWATANNPTYDAVLALRSRLDHVQLTGVRFVRLAMAMLVGRAPLRMETATGPHGPMIHRSQLAGLLIRLAGAEIAADERAALVAELRLWPEAERRAALALSVAAGISPLLEVVGHEDAVALARILQHGTAESPAPEVGAYDLAETRVAAAELTSLSVDGLCELLRESAATIVARLAGTEVHSGGMPDGELVKAVLGLNRDEVTRRVGQLSHNALRAYGALPLAAGESAADRLRVLWGSADRVSRSRLRAVRWRNHLTATRCAVVHLAQVSEPGTVAAAIEGFAGATPVRRREWQDGAYRIGLEPTSASEGFDIAVWRGRMRLKHTPKALYGTAALAEARMAQLALVPWG